MFAILHALGMFIADLFKSRSRLEAENLLLRHPLNDPFICVRSYLPTGIRPFEGATKLRDQTDHPQHDPFNRMQFEQDVEEERCEKQPDEVCGEKINDRLEPAR
jgi:hypothetical protein